MRNPVRMLCTAALSLGLLGGSGLAHAMDYMDGSDVREHGGDLASLYAFVKNTNGAAGPLAVMMAIKPFALAINEVGRWTDYSLRMRPARLAGTGAGMRSYVSNSELRLDCRYFDGDHEFGCNATYVAADGSETSMGEAGGNIGQVLRGPGWRVVTAMRSDPLRTNFHAALNCLDDGEEEFRTLTPFERRVSPKFRNSVEFNKMNVVGLIAQIDRLRLPTEPGMELLAVSGQSVDKFDDGTSAQVDRIGRVGTSTLLIQDDAARNGWNKIDPFDGASATVYREAMQHGLTAVDSHSRRAYWSYPHPLLETMLDDHLLLNPTVASAPNDVTHNHYFEIEWAQFTGQPLDGLAGGRRLTDNAVSRFFSVFARQGQSHFEHLEALKHPLYRPTHDTFPYMAAPFEKHDTLLSRVAAQWSPSKDTIHGCAN
jgi:hypothetical protein